MPLLDTGYKRPTYEDILAGKIQKAKEIFGDNISTDEKTPLGKFIRINAYDQAQEYEDIESIYFSRFPNTATGESLDRLCVFGGVSRNPATEAQHTIDVYGDVGYEIGIGMLVVGDDYGHTFYNINNYTIPDAGHISVMVECTEAGTVGNVPTITKIVNPIAEISKIEYVGISVLGTEPETDQSLRNRLNLAIKGQGACTTDAIVGSVSRVTDVISAGIIVNDTDTADSSGRPPHSFEVYVYGGNEHENEIARAIYEKKPVGIKAVTTASGDAAITETVYDAGGNTHTISFSKVAEIGIKIQFDLYVNTDFTTDSDKGINEIKNNLADYINGLGVGNTVILSAMYGIIYETAGVVNVRNLNIGKVSGSYGTSDIECGENECPICATANINITSHTVGG